MQIHKILSDTALIYVRKNNVFSYHVVVGAI